MLDLRRDRYFQLDAHTASALRRWQEAPDSHQTNEAVFLELVGRGLLVQAADAATLGRRVPPVRPKSLIGELPHVPPTVGSFREVVSVLWQSRRRLKRRGLEAAVEEARRSQPRTQVESDPRLALARFRAARRLVPLAPNCLSDSLALSAFLTARGIRSDLVFGVKLDPFAAHCWIQNEHAILNDAADSVSDFTPILAA